MAPPEPRSMPSGSGDRGGEDLLMDARGTPLVVGLRNRLALDPRVVGNGASLLAAAGGFGLPVPDGVVMTRAGLMACSGLTLTHAWERVRGTVSIVLTDQGPRSGLGASPTSYDVGTWSQWIDGMGRVLEHDMLENPDRRGRPWGVLVLRVPTARQSVLLHAHTRRRMSYWAARPRPRLTWRGRRTLRGLGRLAVTRLGRPVSLVAQSSGHDDWVVVDLRFPESTPT